MIKVSVIIPVYNAERYLKRCLDSVIVQTLNEIEIICVDDGSTDSSLQILEEYAVHEPRMRVIHKKNGGSFSARRAGEKVAQGQYIGYVDSDDWIEPQMYKELYDYACKNHADMVTSGYFMEGNYISEVYDAVEAGIYEGKRMQYLRENTLYCMKKKAKGLRGSMWCKLFSRELIEKIPISISDHVSIGEDELCVLTYIIECNSVVVLKEAYYHYMINPSSKLHSANSDYLLNVYGVYQYLISLYNHPNFTVAMRTQAELYIMELLFKGMNTLMGFQTRNLLWFDPYWLEIIPSGSRVILYGAGEAGRKCRQQLLSKKDLEFAGCVDFGYEKIQDDILQVQSPEALKKLDYDYIVITIKNPAKAAQIRAKLEETGVWPDKILWFEQPELFWKYAEAEGLLMESQNSGMGINGELA